jgi:hypothetical protein
VPAHWTRLLALVFLILASPASAANEWWIGQSSGTVWILEEGRPPRLASPGTVFPNAATLATGPTARALLVHGAESVLVGPSTVLALVQRGGRTRVVQVSGVAEFEVERRNVQHFSVDTRYFATVVKGTHFTVSVDEAGASVAVARGVVEVTAPESGQRTDLTAGMKAVVTADNPAIGIIGGRPVVFQIASPRITGAPPAVAGDSGGTILVAAAANEGEEEADEESEDEEEDSPSSAPGGPGDSDGPPRGGDQPGEDHDSGHGNDGDHDDEDNSGHGHDDDEECEEDGDS